jgi:hypothetical protein
MTVVKAKVTRTIAVVALHQAYFFFNAVLKKHKERLRVQLTAFFIE